MNTNTKRLSAMIDSFHDAKSDEILYRQNSASNTPVKRNLASGSSSSPDTLSRPPFIQNYGASDKILASPKHKYGSPGNRESMISDYSASIHEGVPVYMGNKSENAVKEPPVIYSSVQFPVSEETVGKTARTNVGNQAIYEHGKHGLISTPADRRGGNRNAKQPNSLTLKLSESQGSQHNKNSSIGSGNLASESGHSHNLSALSGNDNKFHKATPSENIDHEILKAAPTSNASTASPQQEHSSLQPSPQRSFTAKSSQSLARNDSDARSLASSIVPALRTDIPTDPTHVKFPDRSSTSTYNPSIPPRSRNRPKSHLFIKDGLEDIQKQLQEQMSLESSQSVSRASTNKSSSYFSAADQANLYDDDDDEDNFGQPDEDSYLHRPLPTVPTDNLEHRKRESLSRNDTLILSPVSQEDSSIPPRMPSLPASLLRANKELNPDANSTGADTRLINDNDDEYEDILDEPQGESETGSHISNTKPKGAKSGAAKARHGASGTKRTSNKNRKQELRSFDIDTISQMLNVTKGTLIGSEFANLGMKTEEKRALERLVDSLSRLTADMVLDPERFQEGMKRLDKATRALEGF
ncbi:LADA_0B07844g1_1 [Lachancea dasiensis]|uniref:LADA_0B07844g1_1 n=1 Tax=Lachancea dasiensis TaxID=1072105 RepID=A0A1G4IU04_9SACH|nr:LADA_0B07844g1_1 [Lachancea dasiensis]